MRRIIFAYSGTSYSPTSLARFLAEARSAAALTHPNIVTIYQVGECPAGHYFAMEYIDGQSLAQVIKKPGGSGTLDWKDGYRVAVHLARALEYAHELSIVHRNITPANVIFRISYSH